MDLLCSHSGLPPMHAESADTVYCTAPHFPRSQPIPVSSHRILTAPSPLSSHPCSTPAIFHADFRVHGMESPFVPFFHRQASAAGLHLQYVPDSHLMVKRLPESSSPIHGTDTVLLYRTTDICRFCLCTDTTRFLTST